MQDLPPFWIKVKAGLFVLLGGMAATLLVLESPTWTTVGLLALTVWACCRAYYFAFYVVEHYVDPSYKFAGLGSFARWWWSNRNKPRDR